MSVERHQRLQKIFTEARRLERTERAAFLDEACNDEADLRRDVDALLAADADEGTTLDAALEGGGAGLLAREVVDESVPETIGRYRIHGVIGEGGMGVVYEAEQRNPKRAVALKVLRTAMLSERALRRFEHEAQVLGRLDHPGIAQILEAGTYESHGQPQPFLTNA